ncbi:MAG: DUF4388 domain-containing protein [bacterium]|nr:DUF4388 domain-containing protein [bacterium]
MAICGTLSTMTLVDLLRWAASHEKTGVLELERSEIVRSIEFRKGWIGSCSSNDPATRIGQYLLSRGKINETELSRALRTHETSGKRLGMVLVEMDILPRAELAREVASKARETVHGLFDWQDAVFRFLEGATLDPDQIAVSISVDDIIQTGKLRRQQLNRVRAAFPSSGIILARNPQTVIPAEVTERPIVQRIFESIDGERTIGEVLLHARASQLLVLKFLERLVAKNVLEVREVRRPAGEPTLLDVDTTQQSKTLRRVQPSVVTDIERFGRETIEAEKMRNRGLDAKSSEAIEVEIGVARRLMERGEHEAALKLLGASCRARPGDEQVRQLIGKAEQAFVEANREDLSSTKIPVLRQAPDRNVRERLGSEGSFLLDMIDGRTDIKSMLWLSPLREIDVFKGLMEMMNSGLIELRDRPLATAAPSHPSADA